MRKYISVIGVVCLGAVLFIGSMSGFHHTEDGLMDPGKIPEYGKTTAGNEQSVSDYYIESLSVSGFSKKQKKSYLDRDDVYAVGKNIIISTAEIQQYMDFYEKNGENEENAYQLAFKDASERNALYVAAIQNGYDVTDEEITAWLSELREVLEGDTSGVYQSVLEEFDSEEAYWNYEFEVYRIDLPIQNYVFAMQQSMYGLSEFEKYDSDASMFEAFKHQLAEEQKFELTGEDF